MNTNKQKIIVFLILTLIYYMFVLLDLILYKINLDYYSNITNLILINLICCLFVIYIIKKIITSLTK